MAACGLLWVGPATTAPKPSEISSSWELDFEYDHPKRIEVRVPGETQPRAFWFMLYRVVNQTGADQVFSPELALYTDTGQLLRQGSGVPSAVFQEIQRIYNDPLLRKQSNMVGRLLQGTDNSKRGVAIWQDIDPNAGAFSVFFSGLSGETVEVDLPVPIEYTVTDITGEEQVIQRDSLRLTRTLQLQYDLLGETGSRGPGSIRFRKRSWVMR
jgi:hypothetical protein